MISDWVNGDDVGIDFERKMSRSVERAQPGKATGVDKVGRVLMR